MSKSITVTEGASTRQLNGLTKIKTNEQYWVPKDDAINFIKKESIKITKNGVYHAPKGIFYSNIVVKVKRKDRAKADSTQPTVDDYKKEYEGRNVSVKQIREPLSFQSIKEITTASTDTNTVTWIPEEEASLFVNSQTITIEDNGTFNADANTLYGTIIVHVRRDEDDEASGDEGNLNLITKTITANGTYNASDDGAKGYSSVTVNVAERELFGYSYFYDQGRYTECRTDTGVTEKNVRIGTTIIKADNFRVFELAPKEDFFRCISEYLGVQGRSNVGFRYNNEKEILSKMLAFDFGDANIFQCLIKIDYTRPNIGCSMMIYPFRSMQEIPFFGYVDESHVTINGNEVPFVGLVSQRYIGVNLKQYLSYPYYGGMYMELNGGMVRNETLKNGSVPISIYERQGSYTSLFISNINCHKAA